MAEESDENIVVRSILNRFLEDVAAEKNIPRALAETIEALRNERKIAKGNHLKQLLTSLTETPANED